MTLRNIGARAGDEVAQLYLSVPGRAGAPLRSLKGYQRVHLAAGESKRLTFTLEPRDLALADEAGAMKVDAAAYRLWVGGGQPGTGAPGSRRLRRHRHGDIAALSDRAPRVTRRDSARNQSTKRGTPSSIVVVGAKPRSRWIALMSA